MRPSVLLLERHFFTKVEVHSHPDGNVATANLINCKIELAQSQDDPKRYQITLGVKVDSQPETKCAYTGDVHIVGLFRVSDAFNPENISEIVRTNGTGVLFGAVREMFLNLTSRGPWPGVLLNTLDFRQNPVQPEKSESAPKSPSE